MRLSRERKNNCAVIFAEFLSQLLVVTDDEDRLILKEHVPEKCPDTILSLFNHLKKLLTIPCIIPVDVNVRCDSRKCRSVRNGRQISELGKLKHSHNNRCEYKQYCDKQEFYQNYRSFVEKVSRFDRISRKGVHRLFWGCISF